MPLLVTSNKGGEKQLDSHLQFFSYVPSLGEDNHLLDI